jgi:hypothetical protein
MVTVWARRLTLVVLLGMVTHAKCIKYFLTEMSRHRGDDDVLVVRE